MAKFENGKAEFLCSFCGRGQPQVIKIIAGPGVFICDECVVLCNEILAEEGVEPNAAHDGWNLDSYLAEIAKQRPLTADDVRDLLETARSGDDESQKKLINGHLGLAADLAYRLAPPTMSQLEAVQEANLALMRCIAAGKEPALVLGEAIRARFEELEAPG